MTVRQPGSPPSDDPRLPTGRRHLVADVVASDAEGVELTSGRNSILVARDVRGEGGACEPSLSSAEGLRCGHADHAGAPEGPREGVIQMLWTTRPSNGDDGHTDSDTYRAMGVPGVEAGARGWVAGGVSRGGYTWGRGQGQGVGHARWVAR